MKLASKIILLMIVAVVAVTSLSSYFTSRQFVANVERQHQDVADALALLQKDNQFHQALGDGESLYLMKLLKGVTDEQICVDWSWMSRETSVYSNGEVHTRKTIQRKRPDGTTVLATYCPMTSGDRQGYFEISSPLEEANQNAWNTWRNAVMSIGALGLLSIGVVMIGGVRLIARPLEQLTDKIHRIGEGDLASDLEINSNDEMKELGNALNRMCDQLRQQKERIEQQTKQRIQTLEQLRHADRLKTVGQLAAGFAHEVGTPLNVVSARAQMILDDQNTEAEITNHVAEIKSETARMSQIVQKLLDFARRGTSDRATEDLNEIARKTTSLMEPLASKRNIGIELDLPAHSSNVFCDANQIQQVILNLIDNAMDASTSGDTVAVSIKQQSEEMILQVADTGKGMNDEQVTKIFEPFFTTKEVGEGTGLGLSIVHGIITEHGGTITVESKLEQGTTVTIKLPVKPVS